jgi:hypothetical protein
MNGPVATVFLVDVDNILLDNDRVEADLRQHRAHEFGTRKSLVAPITMHFLQGFLSVVLFPLLAMK